MGIFSSLLHFLGVPALTPWTEAWLVGIAAVFAAELALIVRIWTIKPLTAFRCYLVLMLWFPLSFTHTWDFGSEVLFDGMATMAAIEAVIRIAGRLRAERRDVVKAILFTALALVLWAWTRNPQPFPNWPRDQYYVRLYTHIACISMLAVALAYSVRERAERFYQAHAALLLAWFLIFFRADRWFYPAWAAEGWYRNGVTVMAGLAGCLAGWRAVLGSGRSRTARGT